MRRVLPVAALLLAAACSGDGPTEPEPTERLEAVPVSGDEQFGEPGTDLTEAFELLVRSAEAQTPRDNVRVRWEIVEGPGGSLSRSEGFTNEAGRARTSLTLGQEPAAYRVRASFPDDRSDPLEFRAWSVVAPELTSISPNPLVPGQQVVLEGENFIADTDRIAVLFSGLRGEVLSGEGSSLTVLVPECLNEPEVDVEVVLGPVASDSLRAGVDGEGRLTSFDPGEIRRIDDPDALSCLLLPGGSSQEYLAVVHSTAAAGAILDRYSLVVRTPADDGGGVLTERRGSASRWAPSRVAPPSTTALRGAEAGQEEAGEAQARWDRYVRRLDSVAVARAGAHPTVAAAPARVPELGDRRTFKVLQDGNFDTVDAEVKHVGERAVIYLDDDAEGSFEDGDLGAFGAEFDDPIHPSVTTAFGQESDLDGNARVIILFTPAVNRLTEPGSDGFVGGFFYGVDLLPDREGSNGGEIFYALVPDPDGEYGDPRSRTQVLRNVPPVMAHEFQHMVHFNERVLELEAGGTDALWLSEALATTAEDLVADAFLDAGNPDAAWTYRSGNYRRARRYLMEPGAASLVVHAGQGTLEERGAGWLFLRHLRGPRPAGLLAELTQTTLTGVLNVTTATGADWTELVEPWTAALYLDGLGLDVPSSYVFADFDLRGEISRVEGDFPLEPPVLGAADSTRVDAVHSSTADHVILSPAGSGGLAVNLAGRYRGPLPPDAGLTLTLVRIE